MLPGPRQAGKTTLALALAAHREALYLDLESEQDRAKLVEPELHLAGHLDRLVILDEIHRAPGLLPALLGIGDSEALLSHPVVGASWEGFAVEQLLAEPPTRKT